jgi:hypothetical protein
MKVYISWTKREFKTITVPDATTMPRCYYLNEADARRAAPGGEVQPLVVVSTDGGKTAYMVCCTRQLPIVKTYEEGLAAAAAAKLTPEERKALGLPEYINLEQWEQ